MLGSGPFTDPDDPAVGSRRSPGYLDFQTVRWKGKGEIWTNIPKSQYSLRRKGILMILRRFDVFNFLIDDLGSLPRRRSRRNSKEMGSATPENSGAFTQRLAQIGNMLKNFGGDDQVEGIILEVEGADIFADGTVSLFSRTALFIKCPGIAVRGREDGSQRRMWIQLQDVHFRELRPISLPDLRRQKLVALIGRTEQTCAKLGRAAMVSDK